MKKLATVRSITKTADLPGFDNVYMAYIDGWQAIVRKEDFKTGDTVVFIEPGAECPQTETFAFLEKRKYRIKTMKMRGFLSQGLVMNMDILKPKERTLGEDVTKELGIKDFTEQDITVIPDRNKNKFMSFLMSHSWTRWIGKLWLTRIAPKKESFPSFISKTDEERIQNMPDVLDIKADMWVGREKVDGCSGTWAVKKKRNWYGKIVYDFYCCSRNLRLDVEKDKALPQVIVAEKYKLKEYLIKWMEEHPKEDWVCIQGECIGPKIQGNPYKVNDHFMYVFNCITSSEGKLSCMRGEDLLNHLKDVYGLPAVAWAPVVFKSFNSYLLKEGFEWKTVEDALEFANGSSAINREVLREGIVVRNYKRNLSFKIVSPEYLIKKGE